MLERRVRKIDEIQNIEDQIFDDFEISIDLVCPHCVNCYESEEDGNTIYRCERFDFRISQLRVTACICFEKVEEIEEEDEKEEEEE